jgi:hypothetical protein
MAVERRRIFPYSGGLTMHKLYGFWVQFSRNPRQVLSTIDRESLALLHVRYLAAC